MHSISFIHQFLRLRFLTSLLILFLASQLKAQTATDINIDHCIKLATEHYPLIKQKANLLAMSDNNIKNINAQKLPQVSLNGRATYQSEVTSFDFPGFPAMNFPKDQYNFGLQINQTIYDGGVFSAQKRTENAGTSTEIQKNEVELYKLQDRIVQLYGNILLTKVNIKVLESMKEDIQGRINKMSSAVKNGTLLQSNVDVLGAEMLKTDQRIIEAHSNLTTLCEVLSLFVGSTITETTTFADMNVSEAYKTDEIKRPELKLFSTQQNLLDEKISLVNHKAMPKISAFVDGAYGRPGYNFLNQNMRVYGIGGISLNWNLNNLHNKTFEKSNLQIGKKMVDEQQELFMLNVNALKLQQNGEIVKLRQLIDIDKQVVEKRKSISKTTSDLLDNGIITSSEYLTELNAEKQAELSQRMHEIQLGISIKNYHITTGN